MAVQRKMVRVLASTMLLASLSTPAWGAFKAERTDCPGQPEVFRIDEKVCPATPERPAILLKRACCINPAGKVNCRQFSQCPKRSPS